MNQLAAAKRLIVKIGSSLLVDESTGQVRRGWLETVAADIAACKARGQEVIVVSSGAVAVGRRKLGLTPPLKLEEKQAAAATGQIRLAHAWQDALAHHSITVAQVLLTLDDSENRRRYLNARSTLETLLRLGAVPVINENDTVATAEIRVGDNDRLAARVAQMVSADALVLFSDIDGLYTNDPRKDPTARFIPEVHELTPEIEAMAGDPGSAYGSGGMVTKLVAARICLSAGCRMAITRGEPMHPLKTMEEGGRCTWFLPNSEPRTARKQWIFGSMKPTGTLVLDTGAARALAQGRSLLPAGITEIAGSFERGDCVLVKDADGKVLGRGLVAYSAEDARAIMGRKSGEIEAILGFRGRDELIHRDDLVMEG
ncbi:Glutamate 5-kinase / RNA-binding C-terminal domain PUA [Paramagnetospirillum magnetotacticum MS-1]|uniref:Glutamate 5-kinase n=1 Tax=Paramagnetospirillum magnetotacticum MS-1 TaxID=272627 RepID=A0A0C2UXN5_PARME|nr:glutamate 5-kinase [Paramagnetospirillum magnetotacticum]KIL97581.1 Glutamate 5-kinase / RNA-binding C-terminal domain PUA [Paramagnetospirillum magnetotacticum MS-1]